MYRLLPLVLLALAACATAKKPAGDQLAIQAPKAPPPMAKIERAPEPAVAETEDGNGANGASEADEGLLTFPVVSFEFDSETLTAEGRDALDAFARRYQKQGEQGGLLIEGHADERGLEEYNLVLGQKRAASVRRYLSVLGVPERAIKTISYGENRPVDDSRSEDAFAKNRRAEVHPGR